MKSWFKKTFLFMALAAGLFLAMPAAAEDINIEAEVDATTVELGSSLQLTITVKGVQSLAPIQLPEIDGFQAQYLGPSTQMTVVNGKLSSSVAFRYMLYPQSTGKFTVPSLQVNIQGQEYSTRPLSIEVTADSSAAAADTSSGTQSQSLSDKIFVRLFSSKETLFLGERIPVVARLYVGGVAVQDGYFSQFEHVGFQTDDFQKKREYPQTINGIDFQIAEYAAHIFPTRTGELTLGPLEVACNIRVKQSNRRSGAGRRGSFFEDDFFDNFFSAYELRPITLESSPLRFTVLDLPSEGKPDGFSGAVGQFEFAMSAGPINVKAGDPVTIKMQVSGEGNLKSVTVPVFEELPGIRENFKIYDAQISEKDGTRISEQVLIPLHERVKEVPVVSFSFFDPESRQYKTITQGPFALTVSPSPVGANVPLPVELPVAARSVTGEEKIGQDLVFIKTNPGPWQPAGFDLLRSWAFRLSLFLVLGVWIFGYFSFNLSHRLRTDIRFARRMLAPKQARAGLALAEKHLQNGEQKEFYDAVFKTMQEYFGNKFHLAAGAVNADSISQAVEPSLKNASAITEMKELWQECEMVRYAQAPVGKDKMNTCFVKLQETIDHFERV